MSKPYATKCTPFKVRHKNDYILTHTYRFLPLAFTAYAERVDSYQLKGGWHVLKLVFPTHHADDSCIIFHTAGEGITLRYVNKPGIDMRQITKKLWLEIDSEEKLRQMITDFFY